MRKIILAIAAVSVTLPALAIPSAADARRHRHYRHYATARCHHHGGATGAVRSGTAFARGIQSGYLRAYALALILGLSALGLYFLLQAS